MRDLPRSRHRWWRGVPLGGALQRACRFCLTGPGAQAKTSQVAGWCRPEVVVGGNKPTQWQIHDHARALRSIGARKIRREGREWVWELRDEQPLKNK
jgi:hypothetical protein